MTGGMFRSFLSGGMVLCALMILVWVARLRSRGATAVLMAAAFAAFGALLYAISVEAGIWVRVALSALVGALLLADFAVRARNQTGGAP